MRKLKFIVRRSDFGCATRIECAVVDDQTGVVSVAKPVEFQEVKEHELSDGIGPMLAISKSHAGDGLQDLMDQLWQLGIRPSDIGTPGHLAATQQHLADMRAIVSKQLDVKL